MLLHADRILGSEHGAVHAPVHLSTAYQHPSARDLVAAFQGTRSGSVYARQGNPTTTALEAKLAMLEGGHGCVCFSTGMAAIAAICVSLLKAGDHIVCSRFLFGNTASLLKTLELMGVEVSFVDATQAAHVQSALRPCTRMVLAETIANPRTQIADLRRIGSLCAQQGLLYVVDGTLTTPMLCQAADFGASLVVHSLSKGISGHGNAMGGAVVDTGVFDWSRYPNILERYRKGSPAGWGLLQLRKKGLRDFGASLRAEDAHRIAVGAETLFLRMERACENAMELASWLQQQAEVKTVHYPGLASHPQHQLSRELFAGRFGTLLSFELQDGLDLMGFLDALSLVIVSTHLADNRTLAIPVAHTIFHEIGAQARASMEIADGLVRLSVGIEDINDLQRDLGSALARCRA
jgi:O-acetylhomoserine (thiol)-lyase